MEVEMQAPVLSQASATLLDERLWLVGLKFHFGWMGTSCTNVSISLHLAHRSFAPQNLITLGFSPLDWKPVAEVKQLLTDDVVDATKGFHALEPKLLGGGSMV